MVPDIPSLDVLQQDVRRRICGHCYLRPSRSEALGPEVVRACEETCPIFAHLRMLRRIGSNLDAMLCSRAEVLGRIIDQACAKCDSPGSGPLRRYRDEVIDTVLSHVGYS
jgi:hypothetical protein